MPDENKEELLSELRLQRGSIQGQQTKLKNIVMQKLKSMDAAEIETRLGMLERHLENFNKVQTRIECLDAEEQKSNKREIFGETYVDLKAKLLRALNDTKGRSSLPHAEGESTFFQTRVKTKTLPKLKLTTFSGKFTDWTEFYSMFNNLVHNDDELTNMDKFQHFRSSLTGPALLTIKSLEVNNENYDKALALLKKRFDNRKLIFQEHVADIFNMISIERDSLQQLRTLSDTVNAHLRALETLGDTKQLADALLIHIIQSKLDPHTKAKWEDQAPHDVLPTWEELSKFIESRCMSLESREQSRRYSTNKTRISGTFNSKFSNKRHDQFRNSSFIALKTENVCTFCNSTGHIIHQCQKFIALDTFTRFNEVKRLNLCINCLRSGHNVKNCKSSRCRRCAFKHHTLLHMVSSQTQDDDTNAQIFNNPSQTIRVADKKIESITTSQEGTSLASTTRAGIQKASYNYHILLASALVDISNGQGGFVPCRALLDSASQLHFVTERVAQQLRLPKTKTNMAISGIAGVNSTAKFYTNLTIKSRRYEYTTSFNAFILPEITGHQPDNLIDISKIKIPDNILQNLADPHFHVPQKIDLLIGADLFFELLTVGQIRLGPGLPTLQKTLLGWVVSGGFPVNVSKASCFTTNAEGIASEQLDKVLSKFWEVENNEGCPKSLTSEERECEDNFVRNYERLPSGRYRVALPLREDPIMLKNSFDIALKRFYNLESRLARFPEQNENYSGFLQEYHNLQHMHLITLDNLPQRHYFMPHHCVSKPESSTTKHRVVFDASCKSSSGYSLNDILMVGPKLQDDLYNILLRFRTYRYAVTADITKMYRQVEVNEADSYLQCIIWRKSKHEPLQFFRLNTVTYGTASASFLSTRCLKQLAYDEKETYPIGSRILLSDFYVDDMLTGADTVEEVLKLQSEIGQMLKRGGFILRKWCSNSTDILSRVPDVDRESFLHIDGNNIIKTLGLSWIPKSDEFCYTFVLSNDTNKPITKRSILSNIARIFDPLGLITPIVVKAKILMQLLWSLNLQWDESLPLALHTEWTNFCDELKNINEIKFPRHIFFKQSKLELHGFADASSKAYGACIFIKSIDYTGNISTNLLIAKSRVAPLKSITIPRLELCAALLLAELIKRVASYLCVEDNKIFCWTDSQIVLAWIESNASKWTVFVSNRVMKIQDLTANYEWSYVPTKENPADIVSRGCSTSDLVHNSLWFHGPHFLRDISSRQSDLNICRELLPERRPNKTVLVSAAKSEDLIGKCKFHNTFNKLLNVFSYIFRFYNNCKTIKSGRNFKPLSTNEIDFTLRALIRMVQKTCFSKEYRQLTANQQLTNGAIKTLSPFLDKEGIIRVGGRLKNSNLNVDSRHQFLLPKSHAFTKSLIAYHHYKNFHAGCQSLLAIIRTRFWPVGGKNTVKQTIHRCIRCFRFRPKSMVQLMGDLPPERVQPSRAFHYTGIDFCGPFYVTSLVRGRAPIKAYVCLFICFSTKAVHLEVVSSLTTEAFLAALRRFVARRGKVAKIFSDNATNFVGANNRLREIRAFFNSKENSDSLQQWCREDGIEWCFIPPRSPHFGGLWEARIKSAKHLILRVASNASFTFEELATIVCEAEAVMNSRPISPMSNDPNDLSALTPGHFLIGDSLKALPEVQIHDEKLTRLTRWQRITYIKQHFWSRWSQEYLQSLQQRHKWSDPVPNLAINTMVLVKEENIPPLKWSLGRVTEVYKGKDGFVRVVSIKTARGIVKRAINRLCPLPMEKPEI